MLYSMTGFGKAEVNFENKSISIEIKTLNSKQQDVFVRMPQLFKSKEIEVRNLLIQTLKRGKIDCSIQQELAPGSSSNQINIEVVQNYLNQLKSIAADNSNTLQAVLQLPDTISSNKEELKKEEWEALLQGVKAALTHVQEFRKAEGAKMFDDLSLRINNIAAYLEEIKQLDLGRKERVKERLREALKELKEHSVDQNRFEQELIYYLEKLDINEEKVRLAAHCDYFKENLKTDEESKGKKLGFISQEIGREINTIGSKANDSDIQQIVVRMKDELEKMKEQLLNCL